MRSLLSSLSSISHLLILVKSHLTGKRLMLLQSSKKESNMNLPTIDLCHWLVSAARYWCTSWPALLWTIWNVIISCVLQHGFRRNRSCETQLLEFTHELFNNLAEGKQTDILILDFAKAFDRVNHSLLVHKLSYYGIQGVLNHWIADFLLERRQAVVLNGERSDFISVDSGVPQGSVLGPCLFLVYINDMPDLLTSPVRLFADDTAAYNVVASIDDQKHLQHNLNQLAEWEKRWDMLFHPSKCVSIPVTRRKTILQPTYHLHGHTLEVVRSVKYLGVTLCSDLNWSEHINTVCSKANKTVGFVRRNLKISSRRIKETA